MRYAFRLFGLGCCLLGVMLLVPLTHTEARTLPSARLAVWTPLANQGLDKDVNAFAVFGSDVYVGGEFSKTADGSVTGLNGIARWDGLEWRPLGFGLSGNVYALAVDSQGSLYAAGEFGGACAAADCATTTTPLRNIARWDGAQWHALAYGVDQQVFALAVDSADQVYVGGHFVVICDDAVCGNVTAANHVARWDGSAWHTLGFGVNGDVAALALSASGELYAGGSMSHSCTNAGCAGDQAAHSEHLIRFNNETWSAVSYKGLSGIVYALHFIGNDLYVGGRFDRTFKGNIALYNIARLSNNVWSPLPHGGLGYTVLGLAANGNDLYVAGGFRTTADGAVRRLNHVARLSSGAWYALPNQGLNDPALAVTVHNGQQLFIGGIFSATQDGSVKNLYNVASVLVPAECLAKPAKPLLKIPANGTTAPNNHPSLRWQATDCAVTYTAFVRVASTGVLADKSMPLTKFKYNTAPLTNGLTYQWYVKACNSIGCRKSEIRTFTVP